MSDKNEVEKVFVTNANALAGRFKEAVSERLLWKSVELNPDIYYFLVEGCGLVDGCFGPWVRLVSDVKELDLLCAGQGPEALNVNHVQLIAPAAMTKRAGVSMELLSEIRIQPGTESSPVYEFITKAGQLFTSAPG
ncbi:hypothetical protein [Pseudomonas japonica]|uniref:hypothetical protein n=1 Tax=Pseudomonas japonica TaxID=256466 RepID=UPI001FDFC780|nr:hypothetical protein [Pseudomonas japonica]